MAAIARPSTSCFMPSSPSLECYPDSLELAKPAGTASPTCFAANVKSRKASAEYPIAGNRLRKKNFWNPNTQLGLATDLGLGLGLRKPLHVRSKIDELDLTSPPASDSTKAEQISVDDSNCGLISGVGSDARVSSDNDGQITAVYLPKVLWFAKSPQEEIQYIDRAINASIAGAAGVFALAKIVTVDHNYWHGWTIFEILRYLPIHNWSAYEDALKNNPVLAKMMISGIVYSLGDWIAQCYEGKLILDFNRSRMLRSGFVGFCLHGSLSHFYYRLCEDLFPFKEWWAVPLKVAFDQTIWSGFWNSIYFMVLGLLRSESPVDILSELKATFFPLLTAGWKLWPFAHVITYGVVPVEQRLLWVDCVELVWVTILSMYSNKKAEARILEASNNQAADTSSEFQENCKEGCSTWVSLCQGMLNNWVM